MTRANIGGVALESSNWVQQFKDAMNVNGGDIESATFLDYLLHFLTFGWKVSTIILTICYKIYFTFLFRECRFVYFSINCKMKIDDVNTNITHRRIP